MKSVNKSLTLTGLVLGAMGMSSVAMAGASGNVAVSSDYLWRGMTQASHIATVSGGLDYEHGSGVYLGTWTSNLVNDIEVDVYGGFSKEFGGVGIDVGAIYYAYPVAASGLNNFYEAYVGLSYSIVSVMGYYDLDSKNMYASGDVSYEVSKGLTVGVSGGYNMPDVGDGYAHYALTLTKSMDSGDFAVSVSDTTLEAPSADAAPVMVVSYSMGFDL